MAAQLAEEASRPVHVGTIVAMGKKGAIAQLKTYVFIPLEEISFRSLTDPEEVLEIGQEIEILLDANSLVGSMRALAAPLIWNGAADAEADVETKEEYEARKQAISDFYYEEDPLVTCKCGKKYSSSLQHWNVCGDQCTECWEKEEGF
jgi:hypothetical protein